MDGERPIVLTAEAAREVRRIAVEQAMKGQTYLRLAVRAGGCGGFTYVVAVAAAVPAAEDCEFESHGIGIVCDPLSRLYLAGTTVGFRDEVVRRGFVFDNPNAGSTCPCGMSFGL